MKSILLISLFICLNISSRLYAQKNIDSSGLKIDKIFEKYNHLKGPGCAVAAIQNGKVILKKSYGLANLDYNQPISSSSIFDLGSLAKQFTGLAISTLVQEKKILLSDDIRKYLPQVPNFGSVITVNNLIHHTSGLRDYPEALMAAGWRYNELCTFDDVIRLVSHQQELDFKPGAEQSYCNTGYVLLAAIVEKVTGELFPQWMKSNIFKPLKMNASFFFNDSGRVIPGLATSYATIDTAYSEYSDILTAYGSSCMYSSLDDLSKWVIHFQEMIRLKDPVYLRMLEKGKLANGTQLDYGFGFEIGEEQGLKTISHTGSWAGYRTNIRIYPEQQFIFITLCNADDNDLSGKYARQIAAAFLKGQFKADETEKLKRMPTLQLGSSTLKKYTGDWQLGPPANKVFTFTVDSGRLICHVGSYISQMNAKTENTFFIDTENSYIVFNSTDQFDYKSSWFWITGKRISEHAASTKFSPDSVQLKAYIGIYYSQELETQYKVGLINGKLIVQHFRRGNFELDPIKDRPNHFKADIGKIDFYLNQKNHVAGFKLSGERVRNMRFEKREGTFAAGNRQ